MIQVNLIPDLKAEFLKAQRTRRIVSSIAFLVAASFIGLVVLLFLYVNVAQRKHSKDLTADIEGYIAEYQATDDFDKVVTVQRQLEILPLLHDSKPKVSRIVTYLTVITPKEVVDLKSFDIDFDALTISIVGNADTIADVNKLANTLKNAQFIVTDDPDTKLIPFTNVILSRITSDEEGAQFDLDFDFNSELFFNHKKVSLTVPKIDSTTSELARPELPAKSSQDENELFNSPEEEQDGQ